MLNLHRYLYAISAACFIGLGSGYLTLLPFFLEFEADAMRNGYEFEQAAGMEYSEQLDCSTIPDLRADCKYLKYLFNANSTSVEFSMNIAYTLFLVGLVSAAVGLWAHPKDGSEVAP